MRSPYPSPSWPQSGHWMPAATLRRDPPAGGPVPISGPPVPPGPVTTPPGSSTTGAISHAEPGDQEPPHRRWEIGNGVTVVAVLVLGGERGVSPLEWCRSGPSTSVIVSVTDVEGPPREALREPAKELTEKDSHDGPGPVCPARAERGTPYRGRRRVDAPVTADDAAGGDRRRGDRAHRRWPARAHRHPDYAAQRHPGEAGRHLRR